ncbi:dynein axonemal intermediate chain 3 [Cydia pomonella]|uniref:dynein axonemal intermediate chain 3 n=1 Tax=Cydia pomonella TaxID=82600 RepID=UPI002ADE77A9|nr:dynein axonemal intermediate chain 3 [Cydia pomonella]
MSDSDSDVEEKPVEVVADSESDSYEDEPVAAPGEAQTLVELHADHGKMAEAPPKPRRKRFIPKYDVEGVHRIAIGEETQIQIEMVMGQDITPQSPWKLVSKAKIMENIDVGGELSEFFPLKAELEAYTQNEVLMGFIEDDSNDLDEFYVCTTVESRDHCKFQSEKFLKRQAKKLEKAVQKKPRPWKSLGSEKEITELIPVNTRPFIELEIKTAFPTVYQPNKFSVRDSSSVRDGYLELTPYRQKFNCVFQRRIDTEVQANPARITRYAQTELRYPQNVWTQSIADALGGDTTEAGAGGDTKPEKGAGGDGVAEDDDEDEKPEKEPIDEAALKPFRDAEMRMRRASYIKLMTNFMSTKNPEMDSIIALNTVMDMYCNDYPNLVTQKATGVVYDSMTFEDYVCFTDVRAKNKYVSSAVFHPMWTGIVAIAYADASPAVMNTLSTRPDPIKRAVYGLNPVMIWSHIDSLIPKLYLESPREVKVLSFCPFNENILIGGCINGQVVVWDLTNKLENVEKIEVLSETREKYHIAMNAHMGWMKRISDKAVVPATALSNLMTNHYGAVTAIEWFSPNFFISQTGHTELLTDRKKSSIFCTGSEDGTILIWNLSVENVAVFGGKKVKKSMRIARRPSGLLVDVSPFCILDRVFQPTYKIILGITGQPDTLALQSLAMTPCPITYTYTPKPIATGRKYFTCSILPQKEEDLNIVMYCGSQHGEMRRITWEGHAFNTGEVVNSEYCAMKYRCYIHDGIITCSKKNPFLHHVTMTVGGKIMAIWSDKLMNRPLIWKKRPHRLTDAVWSLYKPSLLFITTAEGNMETWDLLLRSDLPIAVQTLSGTQLTGINLHTLPLAKNIIGVSDSNGSFQMFLDPPIFMIENETYKARVDSMLSRELNVMQSFISWQDEWLKQNPQVLLEIRRKEGALLLEKEEEKRKAKEAEEKRLEEEAEARRLAKLRVIGPAERWTMIVNKLIERTIAVKKRINKAELIEQEKPLRELEAQRLEKERRMVEIMKNQTNIFNDTVAILFPEAIKKPPKPAKTYLPPDKGTVKREYIEDYEYLKESAMRTVKENPYHASFSWEATLTEGKERREALNTYEEYLNVHKARLNFEVQEMVIKPQFKKESKKLRSKEAVSTVEFSEAATET